MIRSTILTGVIVLAIVVLLFSLGIVNGIHRVGAAVYMYTYNAKKNNWWDEVRFVVWGPSSLLLSVDKELQDYIKKMKDEGEGVILEACKACADMYGVSDKLASLGIDVKYMGKPITDMLKSGYASMTF